MSDCTLSPERLAAYLDGELPQELAEGVEAHLAACPQCAAEVAESVSLKRSMRAARAAYLPSAELRARVRQTIAAKPKRAWAAWLWPAASATAAMLLFSVLWLARAPRVDGFREADGFREVADLHLNALASANPLDVVSTDRHTVKPWFQGRVPFSFNLPEFAGTEFVLQGGRVAYLEQQPGAQLFVGSKQHRISVLIFAESPLLDRALPETTPAQSHAAFSMATWHTATLRFILAGDADPATIDRLSAMLRQANP